MPCNTLNHRSMSGMLKEASWTNQTCHFSRSEEFPSGVVRSCPEVSAVPTAAISKCVWVPLNEYTSKTRGSFVFTNNSAHVLDYYQ